MSQPTRSPKRMKNRLEVGYVIPSATYVTPEDETKVPISLNNVSCIGSFRSTMSRQQRKTNQDQSKPTTPRTKRKKISKVRPEYANISPIQNKGIDKTEELQINIVDVKNSQEERRQCNPRSATQKINQSPGLFNEDRVIRARSDVYDIAASGDAKHHEINRQWCLKRYWKHSVIASFISFFIVALLLIITYKTDLIFCSMNIKTFTNGKEVDSFLFIFSKSSNQYLIEEHFRLNPNNVILTDFCEEKRISKVDVTFEKSVGSDIFMIEAKICDGRRIKCYDFQDRVWKKNKTIFTVANPRDGHFLKFELNENLDKSLRIEKIAIEFEREIPN